MISETNYFEELKNKILNYEKKYLNSPKKVSCKLLWWCLKNLIVRKDRSSFSDDQTHVCVILQGRIGDFVIGLRYIKALSLYLNKRISIKIENKFKTVISELLYGQNFAILAEDRRYDAEITLCRYPKLSFIDKKRILDDNCLKYYEKLIQFYNSYYECYHNDFLGYSLCKIRKVHRINQADFDFTLKLSQVEFKIRPRLNEVEVLEKFNLIHNQYITVQSGGGDIKHEFDIRQVTNADYKNALNAFVKNNKLKIVQIGVVGQPELDFIDENLLGKTSFSELLCILKNSYIHIQQEGGMVHLRHFLSSKPSIVIFGPTDSNFYAYSENYAIRKCGNCCCEWLTNKWMNRCIRNYF